MNRKNKTPKLVCPNGCTDTKFSAHQVVRIDVVVDAWGNYIQNLYEDTKSSIYDSETPYGPFQCMKCGAEFDVS